MKTKHYISIVLMLLLNILAASAQTNTLTIPDVTVPAGKTISLPVNLDNTADIVAVQFTLSVPEGITLQSSSAALSERAGGHTVTMRSVGTNKYMAMIFSSANSVIKGRTGKLMSVNLSASSALGEGSEHLLTLSDVVIGVADGSNLATGFSAGKVVIAKSPDLEVSAVNTATSSINPGDTINVSWQVNNIGDLPTTAGWSEQVYLDGEDGASKLLSTTYYENTLNAGDVVSRSAEITVPEILGVDGNATIRVKLVPDSKAGEPSWLRGNNETTMLAMVSVNKYLSLTPAIANVEESRKPTVRFYLSRSGSTVNDETFVLNATADDRIVLQESVTIAKGQSGVYIYAQLKANEVLDDNDAVELAISGNGYEQVTATINIEDDTFPSLTLTPAAQDVEEGGSLTFTITAERAPKEDLEIKLTNDFSSRFTVPAVVLPAGQKSVEVTVEAKQDDVPDVEQVVTFTASAAGYNSASETVILVDDDVPTLQLTLTPDAVSEAAGPLAVVAKLRRTDNINKVVTVKFADDSEDGIYYGRQSVEMAAGVEEVTVNLGPIDNAIVDGERTYNISAAVWIASCSCNANNGTSGGVVTVPLTVYDNDGPALSITSSASVVKEGGEISVTVSRNTETSAALEVTVASDHASYLEYPETVTIPAGQTSATFMVKSVKNDVNDDSFTAIMTVESEGFAKSNVWFMVSDQTLPDAQITAIEVSETEIEVGTEITVTATLTNTGSYELPELTKVGFYQSGSSTALATAYLQAPLAVGESVTMSKTVALPDAVGTYNVYAVANDGQAVKELLYTNNTSGTVEVKAVSPFTFSVHTDKDIYQQNETVSVNGNIQGKDVAYKDIEIYIINDGYRHVIEAQTDESGAFSATYQPYKGQMGHFAVGACYPKEGLAESVASFDVYGIKRTSNSYIVCEALMGEVFNGSFEINNPGQLPISGAKVTVASQPENCIVEVSCPATIAADATANVSFKITPNAVSEGNDWEHIVLNVETNEGATLETTLYYYCYPQTGKIKADVSSIDCTVTKGNSREYAVTITNIGKGETGLINLSINTPWIQSLTPVQMSSLQYGDSTVIVLEFDPEGLQLNVPQTAMIGINCESGIGIPLTVRMEPVSDESGILEIDVCDQFTYNTEESPHVSGAEVCITHPVTGAVIAKGYTNEKGLFEIELPEGYYGLLVTASNHDFYKNNIYVNPGRKTNKTVDLGYNGGINISYVVQPVEGGIEDVYEIVTIVNYETNVPIPVVVLDGPTSIDAESMRPGESMILNYVATNKGLVTALDFHIVLPNPCEDFSMTPLYNETPVDIAPNQSVEFPVLFTRNPYYNNSVKSSIKRSLGSGLVHSFNTCTTGVEHWYKDKCGTLLRLNHGANTLALKACAYGALVGAIQDIIGSMPTIELPGDRGGDRVGTNYLGGGNGTFIGIDPDRTICNPDVAEAGNDAINGALGLGLGPIAGAVDTGITAAVETAVDGHPSLPTILGVGISALTPFTGDGFQMGSSLAQGIGEAGAFLANHGGAMNVKSWNIDQVQKSKRNLPSWMTYFGQVAQKFSEQLNALVELHDAIFGDHRWIESYDETKIRLLLAMQSFSPLEISVNNLEDYKPESISYEMFQAFIERCYNIVNGIDSENVPDYNVIISAGRKMQEIDNFAIEKGYSSMLEMYQIESEKYFKLYNEESNSVCSSISLQFNKKMVMTREAFRGTLIVYNGHDSEEMQDIVLNLTVVDNKGNAITEHEMTITTESTNNFGISFDTDSWTLGSKETGIATILYNPTKYAAPIVPVEYSFSGTLTYTNPYNGLRVTEHFSPITLTVHPSPNLDLTYFMQRDIIGDDPLTEAIEPCEEAEFSLLINNIGYGDATNVKMVTEQPKIVENEKGLLIDFELMSSQLNGGDKTLALGSSVATDFGTIPAKGTSYAQWWIKSSLLGHFTDYDVEAIHVTSYGNPDLTLLNDVAIHELIRSLEITDGNNKLVGFMTNDLVDAEDTPDMLYLSNGEIETVAVATSSNIVKTSDADYTLTVNPAKDGWNYGNLTDPTYGVVKLKKVVRQSDGKEISLRNFWQTDRTLRDGKDPLYENRIHFADNFASATAETYVLTFEPMPDLLLEVASIEGTPAEGTIAYNHVEKVNVMFNKHIDPATFTIDDITLAVQGRKQNVSLIGISTEDNKTFTLDFTELNNETGNGYYVLTVQTAEITDAEGFKGKTGKSIGWNMYKDGLMLVNTAVSPVNAGTITGNRNVQYGETATLTAEANEGYEFSHWTVNGDENDKELVWSAVAISDMNVTANFIKKTYSISVDEDIEGGQISGTSTGIYSYGDALTFVANPGVDYEFCYWIVDDEKAGENPTLTLTVEKATTISAKYKYVGQYHLRYDFATGWNWISSYLNEPQAVDVLLDKTNRIVGQFDETIKDPDLGFVGRLENLDAGVGYKLEALSNFSVTYKGYLHDLESSPIVLHRGWNWISYPYYESRKIGSVVTSAEEGDYIVSQYGFASYADGSWEGSINQFHAGQGYLYKSATDKALAFDFDTVTPKAMAKAKEGVEANAGNGVDAHKYPNTMNITARLYRDESEITDDEYEIYAMSGSELRGIGQCVNGNYYITVYGDKPAEISFIIEHTNTAETYLANETLMFTNDIIGSRKAPYAITIGDANGIHSLMKDAQELTIYSVDGMLIHRNAKMEDIKKLHRGVYIVNGKKYMIK